LNFYSFRGKHGFAAKRVMLFTNAATTFSDHSLKTILDSLRRQDIIVDAIGPTWGQQDEDDENEENNGPNSPTQTNGNEHSDADRPTTNGHHHRTPKKPLTQQQKTGVRVIGEIVNTTEGTLFTFRYNIKIKIKISLL
jgi:ATP-dependent DNA helicase 2 subunit 2